MFPLKKSNDNINHKKHKLNFKLILKQKKNYSVSFVFQASGVLNSGVLSV